MANGSTGGGSGRGAGKGKKSPAKKRTVKVRRDITESPDPF